MSKVLQNAPWEHSAILLTCIKRLLVMKTFFLVFFEWSLKTGFTVCHKISFAGAVLSLVLLAVGFHMASLNTPHTTIMEKIVTNATCHTHR